MKRCSKFFIGPVAYVAATVLLYTQVTPTEAAPYYDVQYSQGPGGIGDNAGTTPQTIENHYAQASADGNVSWSVDSFATASKGSLGASSGTTFTVTGGTGTGNSPSGLSSQASATFGFDDVIFSGPSGGTIPVTLLMQLNGSISANGFANNSNATAYVNIAGDIINPSGSFSGTFRGTYEISNNNGNITITQGGILSNYNLLNPPQTSGLILNVPTNVPVELDLGLTTYAQVLGDETGVADALANYSHTLSFPTSGPVFVLPAGYTANSLEGGIVNNQFVTPEPNSLALAAFGFLGLVAWGWRRRSHT